MPVKTSIPALSHRAARAVQLLTEGIANPDGTHTGPLRPTVAADMIARRFKVSVGTAWKDIRVAKEAISATRMANLPELKALLVNELLEVIAETRDDGDNIARVKAVAELAKISGVTSPANMQVIAGAGVLVVGAPRAAEDWFGEQTPRELNKGAK